MGFSFDLVLCSKGCFTTLALSIFRPDESLEVLPRIQMVHWFLILSETSISGAFCCPLSGDNACVSRFFEEYDFASFLYWRWIARFLAPLFKNQVKVTVATLHIFWGNWLAGSAKGHIWGCITMVSQIGRSTRQVEKQRGLNQINSSSCVMFPSMDNVNVSTSNIQRSLVPSNFIYSC